MTRLVVHADDVGMCHGANRSFLELSAMGTITSGSVMVPCPWFPEIAELAAGNDQLDVGVHLTLNAEKAHYRWAPLTRPPLAAGLTDADGYCWRDVASVRRHAHPDAVEAEWRAQIDRALASGIDVTHLDTHMGSALAPEWCDRYVQVGVDYDVPVLITRSLDAYGPRSHLADVTDAAFEPFVAAALNAGLPVFDRVLETDFGRPRDRPADYRALLGELEDDLVFCAFHPCVRAAGEIDQIEPDQFHVRCDEHDLFGTDEWASWLDDRGYLITGMRELRDEWRARARQ